MPGGAGTVLSRNDSAKELFGIPAILGDASIQSALHVLMTHRNMQAGVISYSGRRTSQGIHLESVISQGTIELTLQWAAILRF